MTVHHFIMSDNNELIKVLKPKDGLKKRGNPYRYTDNGKFASRRKKAINKSIRIYFIDGANGRMISKEEYDDEIAQMLLRNDEYNEEVKESYGSSTVY